MASFTRCPVALEMRPLPLSTSDTVATDTPAACATSLIVILFACVIDYAFAPQLPAKTFYLNRYYSRQAWVMFCDSTRIKLW
ncbi:hypothetical protein BN133_753 [Cronobacter dublinensis 582]|nr:hypothetical protein BN133_753 [Cronobacter dublinensis 582]